MPPRHRHDHSRGAPITDRENQSIKYRGASHLVLGAATSADRSGAFWLAGGVAVSFTAAGLFLATVGFAIGLD
ncbi:MAG: hypothetical protein WBW93_16915, partial [Steroidobacteraceae bacterium]